MGSEKKYSLNYKQMLEDRMPVTFDSHGIEEGQEVERMWLADIIPNRSLGPISSGDVKVFSCSPESKECLPLIYGSHKT